MSAGKLNLYRSCTPIIDAEYEKGSGKSPTEAIIEALAEAEGVSTTDLPPLYDAIDPDALDQMFKNHTGASDAEATLCFRFDTWNIFVRADGLIRICDATQHVDPALIFEDGTA